MCRPNLRRSPALDTQIVRLIPEVDQETDIKLDNVDSRAWLDQPRVMK